MHTPYSPPYSGTGARPSDRAGIISRPPEDRPAQRPQQPPQPPQPEQRPTDILDAYTYPKNMPTALQLIREAVEDEMSDRMFYKYLLDNAPTEYERELISGIRDDEISHFDLFRQVYYKLTGEQLPTAPPQTFTPPPSYCSGIKGAIRGEQNAVKKYRKILYALQDRTLVNVLTGIITDELRHGILYNYIYSKNACRD